MRLKNLLTLIAASLLIGGAQLKAMVFTFPVFNPVGQAQEVPNTEVPTNKVYSVAWHPTKPLFAVASGPHKNGQKVIELFWYDESKGLSGLSGGISLNSNMDANFVAETVAWSPDGKFLAVGGYEVSYRTPSNVYQLQIYSFTIDTVITSSSVANCTLAATSIFGGASSAINSVDWHPLPSQGFLSTSYYLAVGGSNQSNGFQVLVYVFIAPPAIIAGTTGALGVVAGAAYGSSSATVNAVAWSPDGNYLAAGGFSPSSLTDSSDLRIYTFTSSDAGGQAYWQLGTSSGASNASVRYGTKDLGSVNAVAWQLDNDSLTLAAGGSKPANGRGLQVYTFTPASSSLSLLAQSDVTQDMRHNPTTHDFVTINTLTWNSNRPYLCVGITPQPTVGTGSDIYNNLLTYALSSAGSLTHKRGMFLNLSTSGSSSAYTTTAAWTPSLAPYKAQYLTMGGYDGSQQWVSVYQAKNLPAPTP